MNTGLKADPVKKEIVKQLIRLLHEGISVSELKEKYRDELSKISPFEIPFIEQELVNEGFKVSDILKLCDLHVELFREVLASRELKGIPRGHPLDLLIRENQEILKWGEALGLYASLLEKAESPEDIKRAIENIKILLGELRKIRVHYRKNQMLIFPYLEKRGIIAVPRVLWGLEDQVLVKIRELSRMIQEPEAVGEELREKLVSELRKLSAEIGELVFRENKILYPSTWVLLSEGEWAAISEIADELGWIIETGDREWKPSSKPLLPFELGEDALKLPSEKIEALPQEMRQVVETGQVKPDTYIVRKDGDLDLGTGFLTVEEVKAIFRSLPLEITYADMNDRVRFFTESTLKKGFPRAKTIIGRRLEYCHPPRLEGYVKTNVEALKQGKYEYREFWTRLGDRIIRVIVAPVKSPDGRQLGTIEIVEDMTEIIDNPDEVRKRIVVL